MFSSPLSDLAVAGSTTERTKGNIYESIDSAQNNSTTSHHTGASLLRDFCRKRKRSTRRPPGGYPNFTTAAGDKALQSLTTGAANTAIGNFALFSVSTGNANTAVGALALDLNIADNNTAIGTAALLFNTIGTENTATGTAALETNLTGAFNTANGAFALFSNTAGESNTAIGDRTLLFNITGNGNIALGANAGVNLTTGDNNIDIGNIGVAGESSMIRIGDLAVHEGIFLAGITAMTPEAPNQAVLVDPTTGQLGSVDVGSLVEYAIVTVFVDRGSAVRRAGPSTPLRSDPRPVRPRAASSGSPARQPRRRARFPTGLRWSRISRRLMRRSTRGWMIHKDLGGPMRLLRVRGRRQQQRGAGRRYSECRRWRTP